MILALPILACLAPAHKMLIPSSLLFGDDLDPSSDGAVYAEVRGMAPNRRLIIQWHQVPHYSIDGAATFQVIL